jgi:hypothetical protein
VSQVNQPLRPIIVYLSLATTPFLGSLLMVHKITHTLGKLGEASEEVFRGDRLPILNFTDSSSINQLS